MMFKQIALSFMLGIGFDIAVAAAVSLAFTTDRIFIFAVVLGALWLVPIALGVVHLAKACLLSAVLGRRERAAIAKQIHASGAARFSPYGADIEDFAADVLGDPAATPEAREFVKELIGYVSGFTQAAPMRALLVRRQLSAAVRTVQSRSTKHIEKE